MYRTIIFNKSNKNNNTLVSLYWHFNTVTCNVSNYTARVLSSYHINITLPQSQVPSVNTQPHFYCYYINITLTLSQVPPVKHSYIPVVLSYLYYINFVTNTFSEHTATVISCYHIDINLTQSHLPQYAHS
jgi:hypothetical protein